MPPTGTTENTAPASTSPSSSPSSPAPSSAPASSSGSTPAAAPASSTPSVGSALESLERIAAKDAAPASSTGAPSTPADGQAAVPTTPATGGAATSAVPPPAGAPEVRIQAATRNAREQATRETEQRFAWTKGLDAQQGSRAIANHQRLDANPTQFFYDLGRELGLIDGGGNFAPQSMESAEDDLVDPEPDLRSPDGKVTGFSADANRLMLANAVERLRREMRGELQPFHDEVAAREQAAQDAAITREGQEIAKEVLAVASQYPHFQEYRKEIGERLRAVDPAARARLGAPAALLMAYNAVMAEKVLPGLSASSASAAVADMNRSAAAGAATIGPGVGTVTKPAIKDGDLSGLAKRMAEIESAQA